MTHNLPKASSWTDDVAAIDRLSGRTGNLKTLQSSSIKKQRPGEAVLVLAWVGSNVRGDDAIEKTRLSSLPERRR
jgi:hypothetical protein